MLNNPMIQQMASSNPQMASQLQMLAQNPQLIQQAMSNPMMQRMMRDPQVRRFLFTYVWPCDFLAFLFVTCHTAEEWNEKLYHACIVSQAFIKKTLRWRAFGNFYSCPLPT